MAQKMAVQRARGHIRNSRKSREDVIFEYIVYIILALISLIIIYPLWFVLIASFSEAKLVVAGKVLWRPVGLTLDNYAECFKNGDLMIGYKNSLGILFLGTATNLVLTTLCAYPLSRRDLWGKNAIMMYATFPMFFSGGMIPTYLLVARTLGLSNSWWAVILVGGIATYNMIIMRTFFSNSIPYELQEAAQIDGAGTLRCFIHVVLPVCQPILGAAVALSFADCWNLVEQPLTYLTTHTELYPLSVVFNQLTQQSTGVEFAGAALYTLPALLIYLYFQNDILEGVQLTELK